MKRQMRITGLYDQRTIQWLAENKISSYGVDLRPRSLNFIQTHRLVDLLHHISWGTLYLHFENEKDFVIKSILDRLQRVFLGEIILEFSDERSGDFYDQFQCPYILLYTETRDLKEACGEFFRGFVFSSSFLEEKHQRGYFQYWLRSYYKSIGFFKRQPLHFLNQLWSSDIFPSLFEYLDFDVIGLPISSDVEICFRNVNLKVFKEQIDLIKRQRTEGKYENFNFK